MKSRLKIQRLASYLAIAGIFALLAPHTTLYETKTAHADEGPRIEITGSAKSEATAVNGIVNSGTIHFTDFVPLGVNQQAHLIPVSTGGVIDYYEMRGWAWSDNLGWISFYCDGQIGVPGSNEGAACGEYSYSVRFDASGNIKSGTDPIDGVTEYSWAWNTAMGWISFTSANHTPPPASPNYGVNIDVAGLGDFQGYAWSQTIGYINFQGPIAEFTDTPTPQDCDLTPGVCVKIKSAIPDNEVIADGVDYHEVYVYIKDENLNPIEQADIISGEYRVSFFMEWTDTLKSLQAPTLNIYSYEFEYQKANDDLNNENIPFWNDEISGGVLSKPVVMSSPGSAPLPVEAGITADNKENLATIAWKPDPAVYTPTVDPGVPAEDGEQLEPQMVFLIKSVAPSSDANFSTTTKGATEYNEDFSKLPDNVFAEVAGLNSPDNLEDNILAFNTVAWLIEEKVDGVYEPYPEVGGFKKYTAVDNEAPVNLSFKPALFVSELVGPGPGKYADQLVLYRNTPMEVKLGVGVEKSYEGIAPINETHPEDTKAKLYLVDNLENEFETKYAESFIVQDIGGVYFGSNEANIVISYNQAISNGLTNIGVEAKINESEETLPDYFEQSAGIYTTIEYVPWGNSYFGFGESKPVTYFSNHLPREIGSGVFNPGVEIQGINYSQGSDVESVQEGVNISAVGDININIVRNHIYKRVKQLTTNETLPTWEPTEKTVSSIDILKSECGIHSQYPTCTKFEMPNNDEVIYYFRRNNIVMNNVSDPIIWDSTDNVTIIVENGNIHIEGDLENSNNKKLALVALRDKSADDFTGTQQKVGHIYMGPDVKRVFAFIYGDGTLFPSYNFSDPLAVYDPVFGEPLAVYDPVFGEPQGIDYFDFSKQLLFVGGVSTRNCIGCVDFAGEYYYTPVRQLAAPNPANEAIARLYDLNYLRSFSLGIATTDDGSPINLQCGMAMNAENYETECADHPINPLNTYYDGGDLAVLDVADYAFEITSNDWLQIVDSDPVIVTDKKNPLYVIYSPVNPKSFIFGEDKDLTF